MSTRVRLTEPISLPVRSLLCLPDPLAGMWIEASRSAARQSSPSLTGRFAPKNLGADSLRDGGDSGADSLSAVRRGLPAQAGRVSIGDC